MNRMDFWKCRFFCNSHHQYNKAMNSKLVEIINKINKHLIKLWQLLAQMNGELVSSYHHIAMIINNREMCHSAFCK